MFSYKFSFKEGKSKEAPLIVIPSFEDNTSQILEKVKLLTDKDFSILTIYGFEWNNNLSPYKASAIFKGASVFKGEAKDFLELVILKLIKEVTTKENLRPIYNVLVGYSMAGLFAVYALYNTDAFLKIGSVSGSLWYPNFVEFIKNNEVLHSISTFYMSLGDKEKKTKNKIMSQVKADSLIIFDRISSKISNSKFEFNKGNHFQDEPLRVAKCIAYLLSN